MVGNWNRMTGFIRKAAAFGVAGFMFFSCCSEALAATLKDVFDEHYYADSYEDLKAAYGYDREALWNHFKTFGLKEGRNMNQFLDLAKYRAANADLDAAFGDDWEAYLNHYLTYGAKEGRETGTQFDVLDYAERYADLKAAYGDDVLALWNHYQVYGSSENREARSETVVAAEIAARQTSGSGQAVSTKSGYSKREDYNDGTYSIYDYNANDALVKQAYYNESGELVRWFEFIYNDKNQNVKRSTYNADGTLREWGEFEYDSAGYRVKETWFDANGTETSWGQMEYDGNGKLTRHVNTFASESGKWVNEHLYGEFHVLLIYSEGDYGSRSETIFDESGHTWKDTKYENGEVIFWSEYKYNSAGNRVEWTQHDADGSTYGHKYDDEGREIETTSVHADGSKSVTTKVYDENGNPTSTTVYYDKDGNVIV